MPDAWLTLEDAAARVDRSMVTMRRWQRDGQIKVTFGRVRESQLLQVDRLMRKRAKTPRRQQQMEVLIDGVAAGLVSVNPATGKISGECGQPVRAGQRIELRWKAGDVPSRTA